MKKACSTTTTTKELILIKMAGRGKKDLIISNVRLENDQLEVHSTALIKLYTHSANRLHKI